MTVLGALGDLVLSLSADTARFQSDLGKANRAAEKFGREVGTVIGKVAAGLLVLGGSAGFGSLVKGQIDAADAAGKLSQKIGVSTEQLSAYMVAAQLSDVSNDQLQTGFQQLSKNQAEFVAGTGEAAMAFEALGISQKDVQALNGDTAALFELVAGKLSKFEDGANKTALAMKIFGRSGAELIPLINGLEGTRKEAEQLGAVIDKDTAAAAERFNDNLTRVGVGVQSVGLRVAKVMLPTLESLSERLVAAAKDTESMDKAARVADTGLKLMASAGTVVSTVFQIAGEQIGALAAAAVQIAQGNFRRAWTILGDAGTDAQTRVSDAVRSIEDTWTTVAASVNKQAPELGRRLAAPGLAAAKAVKAAREDMAAEIRKQVQAAEQVLGLDPAAEAERERRRDEERAEEERTIADRERMWQQVFESIDRANEVEMESIHLQHGIGEALKKNKSFAEEFGLTFNSALEDMILKGGDLRDMLRAIGQDVVRMLVRKQITEPLGNAASGLLGRVFGGLGDFVPELATGTPFVPRDMLAVLHKGEAVIPAAQNRPGAMGSIQVVNNNYIDARSDQASIMAMLERSRRQTANDIRDLIARGDRSFAGA